MQSDFSDRPAFEVLRPKKQLVPFIFNCPHSGRDYPKRFLDQSGLDHLSIRQSEDAYVDELFESVPWLGAPLLRAHFPRAYLDVNREPYELDQSMFNEPLPDHVNKNSARVSAGLGTIAKNVSEARPIYHSKLPLADAITRIEGIYKPYHRTLQNLVADTIQHFGVAILIDCHSMPQLAAKSGDMPPDIIIGDRYGSSCSPQLSQQMEMGLESLGFCTRRNRPYAGGFITRSYGRPSLAVHAVQLEISRGLYLNEVTLKKNSSFPKLQSSITAFVTNLLENPLHLGSLIKSAAE